ncbi:speckle targeted PIP5K1A-regulated poly(A) polymerase [Spea bombifrons]|uniref:speckle targeted PIP5K1A-regulated poly(A) polymerase n=1 Tax=Spea bombifrons TaxID=233779 RepID=UPI00234AF725|nr:speckle targeted PIP5K1A-regulated poly(A) polymerase [Spea bombifrons]
MAAEQEGECFTLPNDVQFADRGGFRCLLCGVSIANRPSLCDHLRGRRHIRLCEEREKRQQQQEHSVYVSGFPRGTTEEQLKDLFQDISPVKGILMDKDHGFYAIVEFENKDGVNLCLTETVLKLGKKRLKVKRRNKKEFQRKERVCSEDLQPPDPEALCKELMQCTDVEDQIKCVTSLCSPSQYENHLRELLLSLLQETFTEFFPGCRLLPFGSSMNGFEISGCDLDLYLELGEHDGGEQGNVERESVHVERIEQIKASGQNKTDYKEEVENEDIGPGLSLKGLTSENVLELVQEILRRCVPGVHAVQRVPSVRCPVVRFQHKASGLRGDITLNNRLALRNSTFLRLCSHLDPRVRWLVYAVRYWAKVHQLAGNPLGGGPRLNNYALTLLIIFFLQTRSPPVIPTLSKLREEAVNEAPQVIDDWDCSFPSDPNKVQASTNQQSLCCLLLEFFSFICALDLTSVILCPRNGLILPLPLSPPPSWLKGFRLGFLNLQDPFELSHNVCANISSRTGRCFLKQCALAAQACSTSFYLKRSMSRPWGIALILIPPSPADEMKPRVGSKIMIPLGEVQLEDVCAAVRKVLVDVLLCTCDTCDKCKATLDDKWRKGNLSGKDIAVSTEDEQTMPCTVSFNAEQEDSEDTKENIERTRNGTLENKQKRKEIYNGGVKKRLKTEESCEDPSVNQETCNKLHTESVHLLRVCVWHRVWEGRRKERRHLQVGSLKGAALETAVSCALFSGKGEVKGEEPLIRVIVKARLTTEGQIQLSLTPDSDPHGLSISFFQFLGGFLPRIIKEFLIN